MITYSGVHVFPNTTGAPTLRDIAVSLARMPRFGGHTTREWSVAEHSIACTELVKGGVIQLHLALHDAHECVTEDIPSTWKTPDIAKCQLALDKRIYEAHRLPLPDADDRKTIKRVDRLAVVAEAKLLGPPGTYEWFNEEADPAALAIVEDVMFRFSRRNRTTLAVRAAFYELLRKLHNRYSYKSV